MRERRPRRNIQIEGVEVGTTENMITNSLRSLSTLVALETFYAPSLKISSALSAVAFELDSPERESGEDSTAPCGVKGVVGPGSRAQIRLAVEKCHFGPLPPLPWPLGHVRLISFLGLVCAAFLFFSTC